MTSNGNSCRRGQTLWYHPHIQWGNLPQYVAVSLLPRQPITLSILLRTARSSMRKQRGQGSLLTLPWILLSVIRSDIHQWFSEEVSLICWNYIDTTQYIRTQDQSCVFVKYFDSTGTIHVRLVSVGKCATSTGEDFVRLASKLLSGLNPDLKNFVWNSTVNQKCKGAARDSVLCYQWTLLLRSMFGTTSMIALQRCYFKQASSLAPQIGTVKRSWTFFKLQKIVHQTCITG